jgi:hypothetical protein
MGQHPRRPIVRLALVTAPLALALVLPLAEADERTASPYAQYEFLIGEWDVGPDGGNPGLVARFQWGPNRSYMRYSASLLVKGVEEPHLEGVLMWNGVRKNLDMLLMLDLAGGRVQERGVVSIEPDGTVVREVTASYSEGVRLPPRGEVVAGPQGATVRFRHTFKAAGPDRILTALRRESDTGWVPTFPGSDRLVMKRRAS